MSAEDLGRLLRELAPQVLGALLREHHDFDTCEDALQEAMLAATVQWPVDGVPDHARGWLITVASRRVIDQIRSERARRDRETSSASKEPLETMVAPGPGERVPRDHDDTLTLLFMSEGRAHVERLGAVLHVLYLIFNEGYTASSGPDLQRPDLATEAVRLTRAIHRSLPDDGEVAGLLALMLLTDARRAARTDAEGGLIPLAEQGRTRWDSGMIEEGTRLVTDAMLRSPLGRYQLQAAIASPSRPAHGGGPDHELLVPSAAVISCIASASAGLTLCPSSLCAAATLLARVRTKRRYSSSSSAVALVSSSATASRTCFSPFSLSSAAE